MSKSELKKTLLEAVEKEIVEELIAISIAANQLPDYVIRFDDWYEEYPDGRSQYVGPTGWKKLHGSRL